MASVPEILVLDDGELEDIRSFFKELGVGFVSLTGDAVDWLEFDPPTQLLVATARQALRLKPPQGQVPSQPTPTGAEGQPIRIAVSTDDTKTLRRELRERGFDYLVRRPVHPVALRLLLLRTLYRGDEKRIADRVPVGGMVSYRSGLRRRPALLAELGAQGCRLYAACAAEPATPITIYLSEEMTGAEGLSLPGWVVRCERDPNASPDRPFCTGVAFEPLPHETDRRLRLLVAAKAQGPDRLPAQSGPPANRLPVRFGDRLRLRLHSRRRHRRRAPRRAFWRKVAAVTPGTAFRVLVGRNLSALGMLAEPNPHLRCGDKVSLALFGRPEERVVLHSEVVRDDGESGLALRFESLDRETRGKLEALITGLPPLERLGESEEEPAARVIGEITLGGHPKADPPPA